MGVYAPLSASAMSPKFARVSIPTYPPMAFRTFNSTALLCSSHRWRFLIASGAPQQFRQVLLSVPESQQQMAIGQRVTVRVRLHVCRGSRRKR